MPPEFIVMFAARPRARTVKLVNRYEIYLWKALPEFVNTPQPRVTSNEHFHCWWIGLVLQSFQAALEMTRVGSFGSIADHGDHNRKIQDCSHRRYSTSIKAAPGPNA